MRAGLVQPLPVAMRREGLILPRPCRWFNATASHRARMGYQPAATRYFCGVSRVFDDLFFWREIRFSPRFQPPTPPPRVSTPTSNPPHPPRQISHVKMGKIAITAIRLVRLFRQATKVKVTSVTSVASPLRPLFLRGPQKNAFCVACVASVASERAPE